jgi:hypothetical protein
MNLVYNSIGQLTFYITQYSFLFACIHPSHIPCYITASFEHAISILQSQSLYIERHSVPHLEPLAINTHTTQTTIRLLRVIDIRLEFRSDLIHYTSDHLSFTIIIIHIIPLH